MIKNIIKNGDISFIVMLVLYYSTPHINNTVVNYLAIVAVMLVVINRLWGMFLTK